MNDRQIGLWVNAVVKAIDGLATATLRISHGDVNGPTGLEMLSVSLSGQDNEAPLGTAIQSGLGEVASAMREAGGEIAAALYAVSKSIDVLAEEPPPQPPLPPPVLGSGWAK